MRYLKSLHLVAALTAIKIRTAQSRVALLFFIAAKINKTLMMPIITISANMVECFALIQNSRAACGKGSMAGEDG